MTSVFSLKRIGNTVVIFAGCQTNTLSSIMAITFAESFVQNHLYRLEAKKLWLLILKARTLHTSLDIRVFRMVLGHSKFE